MMMVFIVMVIVTVILIVIVMVIVMLHFIDHLHINPQLIDHSLSTTAASLPGRAPATFGGWCCQVTGVLN